jgi:hypothetical protein
MVIADPETYGQRETQRADDGPIEADLFHQRKVLAPKDECNTSARSLNPRRGDRP